MVTKVINKDNLLEKVSRGAVNDAGDCAQESSVSFVVEDDHHRRHWKVRRVSSIDTPATTDITFILSLFLSHSLSLTLGL